MYTEAEGVVSCPKCDSLNVIHHSGVGNEAYFRCEECYTDYCASIYDGRFSVRINAEL